MAEIPHMPITSRVITVAEHVAEGAWHRFGKTLPGNILLGGGSTSPALVEVKWNDCPDIDPDSVDWCKIDADPEAGVGNIPRYWKNAAILGSAREVINRSCADLPEGTWAQDAVVCLSDGVVKRGIRPDSYKLFGGDNSSNGNNESEALAVLGICRSRGPIMAAMAMIRPNGEVCIPDGTRLLEPSIPTAQVTRFTGTSLIRAPQFD